MVLSSVRFAQGSRGSGYDRCEVNDESFSSFSFLFLTQTKQNRMVHRSTRSRYSPSTERIFKLRDGKSKVCVDLGFEVNVNPILGGGFLDDGWALTGRNILPEPDPDAA